VARSRTVVVLSLLAFAALGMIATPASAYVRKRTDGGIEEYWQVSCIPMTIYMNGYTGMTRDEVVKSITAAAHTWSPSAVTCPDGVSHPFLEIVPSLADENAVPPVPAYDARNTVLFYTPERPYNPDTSGLSWEVVALTAGWARADGHIVDADVRINAYDNQFANLDPNFVPPADGNTPYDLQNAVTHEFGHVLGLGHSCWNIFSDLEQPVDDKDAAVPTCDPSAPIAVQNTVMYATIPPGGFEVKKRTLSSDEIRAVCDIYPASANQYTCDLDTPQDGCGCSASASTAATVSAWCLALLSGGAMVLRRRKASRVASRGANAQARRPRSAA
jgi:hypothetical protein